ncbi:Glycosyl transferase [Trypanosoma melophagium]|uniref:Glycosyl transferase n=1 Tax=Trypanosoma melophagium TaxID=715481 RepID=UPI00351A0952|nr:Glycosyl transferase [Trypanosoma melophagium]
MRKRVVPKLHHAGVAPVTSRGGIRRRRRLMLFLMMLFLLLCWIVRNIPTEIEVERDIEVKVVKELFNSPAIVTLILPTFNDPELALRKWFRPSSKITNAICVLDGNSTSFLEVSVVVVQMSMSHKEEREKINEVMQTLANDFPERKMTRYSGSFPDIEDGLWRSWTFSGGDTTLRSCVKDVVFVSHTTSYPHYLGGYDALDKYVKLGLTAFPLHTKYFLVLTEFLLPVLWADDNNQDVTQYGRGGFMQQLLSTASRNEGRVAAVQCTILSRRPFANNKRSTENKMEQNGTQLRDILKEGGLGRRREQEEVFPWQKIGEGDTISHQEEPSFPIILERHGVERKETHITNYIAVEKGLFVGYGGNWNRTVNGIFLTRWFNGYNALDERVQTWERRVDAVSPFCTLFHRGVYDAVGGFMSSVREETSSKLGTKGWSLLREIPPPDYPENNNYLIKQLGLQNNFPTLWPDVMQADDIIGWELSFRLQSKLPDWEVWSSTAMAVAWTIPMERVNKFWNVKPPFPIVSETIENIILSYYAPSFVLTGYFAKRWGTFAGELFNRKAGEPLSRNKIPLTNVKEEETLPMIELRVLANYAFTRCSGMMMEGTHYFVPLQQRLLVVFWGYRSLWCPGIPQGAMDALYRTQMGVNRWGYLAAWRQEPMKEENKLGKLNIGTTINTAKQSVAKRDSTVYITFLHNTPSYVAFIPVDREFSDYNVARVLTENSRLLRKQVNDINTYLDELWVTCNFFKEVYKRSGVREELMHVIPESVDTYIIDPALFTPFDGLPEEWIEGKNGSRVNYWTNRPGNESLLTKKKKNFIFLSVFKWEPRKGWDVLLSAYWKAFGPGSPLHNDVSLYIKTAFLKRFSSITTKEGLERTLLYWATNIARLPNFTSLSQFPRIVIMYEGDIRTDDIYRLYRSSDAFVLPTRGEGWGVPAMEAMAMELPVLTTNWAGATAFATRKNSFLIPIDGLEELPKGSVYGNIKGRKWAIPSINATAQLMKYVVQNREHARTVGKRARQDVVNMFSEEAVADLINERLREIARKVVRQRKRRWSWLGMTL